VNELRFSWSHAKAADNVRKHRVTFEEAVTVFDDPHLFVEYDATHSDREYREMNIGFSANSRVLMVVTTDRYETIRIISARRATQAESRRYAEQGNG